MLARIETTDDGFVAPLNRLNATMTIVSNVPSESPPIANGNLLSLLLPGQITV